MEKHENVGVAVHIRSASERNLADSGKSWITQGETQARIMVKIPSRIKIHAHPGFPPTPSISWIAAARKPPDRHGCLEWSISFPWLKGMYTLNAPAIVAAEKITAMREPSSERLYQLISAETSEGACFWQVARGYRAANSPR
jgi:hypothetical protein